MTLGFAITFSFFLFEYDYLFIASVSDHFSFNHCGFYSWLTNFDIVIKVYASIAPYFKAKNFLQSQVIEEELKDGSLIVSFEVSHYEDADNIIKSWLPDIEVLEPLEYR